MTHGKVSVMNDLQRKYYSIALQAMRIAAVVKREAKRNGQVPAKSYKQILDEETVNYALENHLTYESVRDSVRNAMEAQAALARESIGKNKRKSKKSEKAAAVVVRGGADENELMYKGLFDKFDHVPYDKVILYLLPKVTADDLVRWRNELLGEGFAIHSTNVGYAVTGRPDVAESLADKFKQAYGSNDAKAMSEALLGMIEAMGKKQTGG